MCCMANLDLPFNWANVAMFKARRYAALESPKGQPDWRGNCSA